MKKLNGWKMSCAVFLLCTMTAIAVEAQTFNGLVSFDGANGAFPVSLVQGADGNFYGTTFGGGAGEKCSGGIALCGTVFKLDTAGNETLLHTFTGGAGGDSPDAGLVQATNGNFYGTTLYGGNKACGNGGGCGTVFEITPAGKLTTLYTFCVQTNCTDGENPLGRLVQATNGIFYGTTEYGGANGGGTVFEITPAGKLTTLYSFCSQPNCTDGAAPRAGLAQAHGNLYGTTLLGGAYDYGTVFEITPAGKLTTLYSFCAQPTCTDGELPAAGLVQAINGNFYGTTENGGANGGGTVFEITPAGQLTTLYSFCAQPSCTDGDVPIGMLVQATDGNFYGTTARGGANNGCGTGVGCGTVFEITPAGQLTTLYNFCSQPDCADGWYPSEVLVQATNGNFYGTTNYGGDYTCFYGCGTVFSLSVGLGPFVETLPGAGKVGAEVGILGNNLTGATNVTFNGTPARFSVRLPTLILTHVPAGATTGTVQVTLSSGTVSSNVPFYVIP